MKHDPLEDDPEAEMIIPKGEKFIWRTKMPQAFHAFSTQQPEALTLMAEQLL